MNPTHTQITYETTTLDELGHYMGKTELRMVIKQNDQVIVLIGGARQLVQGIMNTVPMDFVKPLTKPKIKLDN